LIVKYLSLLEYVRFAFIYLCPMPQKAVITGGPSTGKSTTIKALLKKGYTCMPEIARDITLEARKKGIDQLFLSDPLGFSEILLKKRETQYATVNKSKESIVFFDRGIPDICAYMDERNIVYPKTFLEKSNAFKYDFVFLFPPWEKIFSNDNERYENFEQSLSIHHHLKNIYQKLNYNIIEVPHDTVENRVHFILNFLNLESTSQHITKALEV